MFRPFQRRALSALGGFNAGLWSTGAAQAVVTPALRRVRRIPPPAHDGWDLVLDAEALRARGASILYLFGQVLDFDGQPVPGTRIDIWHCGTFGREDQGGADGPAFLGAGTSTTGSDGHYRFRTIRPLASPGRTPHIHARVVPPAGRALMTELYLLDEPQNSRDWTYQSLGPSQQAALSIDPTTRPDGDQEAGFNFVI